MPDLDLQLGDALCAERFFGLFVDEAHLLRIEEDVDSLRVGVAGERLNVDTEGEEGIFRHPRVAERVDVGRLGNDFAVLLALIAGLNHLDAVAEKAEAAERVVLAAATEQLIEMGVDLLVVGRFLVRGGLEEGTEHVVEEEIDVLASIIRAIEEDFLFFICHEFVIGLAGFGQALRFEIHLRTSL